MKIAKFEVSHELLAQALHLPSGAKILTIGHGRHPGMSRVIVEHSDLVEMPDDTEILEALPTFTRDADAVQFVGWGQK